MCGKKQPRLGPDALYHCPGGCGLFDELGDETGDYSDRNPSARMERLERQQQREREQRVRRLGVRR